MSKSETLFCSTQKVPLPFWNVRAVIWSSATQIRPVLWGPIPEHSSTGGNAVSTNRPQGISKSTKMSSSNLRWVRCKVLLLSLLKQNWSMRTVQKISFGVLMSKTILGWKVHKADAVAVIVGTQWFYLKQNEPNSKLWQGIAFTGRDNTATAEVYIWKIYYPLVLCCPRNTIVAFS